MRSTPTLKLLSRDFFALHLAASSRRYPLPFVILELVTFCTLCCCFFKTIPSPFCHSERAPEQSSRNKLYSAKRRTPRIFPLPCSIREFSPCIFAEIP